MMFLSFKQTTNFRPKSSHRIPRVKEDSRNERKGPDEEVKRTAKDFGYEKADTDEDGRVPDNKITHLQ
jgi:hypothetical protein